MAAKKILDVNESSLVDLKAELFRKEEQFKRDKHAQGKNATKSQSQKPPVWIKPNKAAATCKSLTTKNNKEDSEEDKMLYKSRRMLEAKALLYEKMAKGEIEEEENEEEGRFLVDFHRKIYGKLDVSSEQEATSSDRTEPADPDEQWVDYVDSIGRSRRCLKRDLGQLQKMDKDITPSRSPSPPTLLSEDMRRELMRQKWEKEEEEAMRRPVGPVHYQNVQFDEVRSHGVGYYQFSKDELERQRQMQMLNKLREQTTEQRERREKLKEKRKAALDARLAKVRARKMKRLGEEGHPLNEQPMQAASEEELEEEGDTGRPGGSQGLPKEEIERRSNKEENLKTVSFEQELRRPQDKLPEWARHKTVQQDKTRPSAYNPHDERDPEFAPPNFYYDEGSAKPTRTARRRDKPGKCDQSRHTVTRAPVTPGENNSWSRQEQERGCQDNQSQQQHLQHQCPLPDVDYPSLPPPPQDFAHSQHSTLYPWQPREIPWQRVTSEYRHPSHRRIAVTTNESGPQPSSYHSTNFSRFQPPSSFAHNSCASNDDFPSSCTTDSSSRDGCFEGSQTTDLANYHLAFSTTDGAAVTPSNQTAGPLSNEAAGPPSNEAEGPPSKEAEGPPSKEAAGPPSKEALADFLSYYRHASR